MSNIRSIQNKIKKYNNVIESTKEKLAIEESALRREIINTLFETHFTRIRTVNGYTEYLFASKIEEDSNEKLAVTGIKISRNDKRLEEGKLNLDYLITADDCIAVEPTAFLGIVGKVIVDWYSSPIRRDCSLYFTATQLLDKLPSPNKAVAYCRESRKKGKFDRQIKMIKDRAINDNTELIEWFTEKVSGTTSLKDRTAVIKLLEFCNLHEITTVYVSELDRIGRKAEVIKQGIAYLRANGIKTIVAVRQNISIDEKYLIERKREFNALCLKAEEDRIVIVNRMHEGYKAFLEKYRNGNTTIKLGRPKDYKKPKERYLEQYSHQIELLKNNVSLRTIRTITGTSVNTLRRIKKICINEEKITEQ